MSAFNRAEELLARSLAFAGYPFEREYRFSEKRKWRADFYLPPGQLIIEIEGVSYAGQPLGHQTGKAFEEDLEKYNEMTLLGFSLLRFTPAMITGSAKRRKPLKEGGFGYDGRGYEACLSVIDRFFFTEKALGEVSPKEEGYAARLLDTQKVAAPLLYQWGKRRTFTI